MKPNRPTSIRPSERTVRQINDLLKAGFRNVSSIIKIAIDRLWQKEVGK